MQTEIKADGQQGWFKLSREFIPALLALNPTSSEMQVFLAVAHDQYAPQGAASTVSSLTATALGKRLPKLHRNTRRQAVANLVARGVLREQGGRYSIETRISDWRDLDRPTLEANRSVFSGRMRAERPPGAAPDVLPLSHYREESAHGSVQDQQRDADDEPETAHSDVQNQNEDGDQAGESAHQNVQGCTLECAISDGLERERVIYPLPPSTGAVGRQKAADTIGAPVVDDRDDGDDWGQASDEQPGPDAAPTGRATKRKPKEALNRKNRQKTGLARRIGKPSNTGTEPGSEEEQPRWIVRAGIGHLMPLLGEDAARRACTALANSIWRGAADPRSMHLEGPRFAAAVARVGRWVETAIERGKAEPLESPAAALHSAYVHGKFALSDPEADARLTGKLWRRWQAARHGRGEPIPTPPTEPDGGQWEREYREQLGRYREQLAAKEEARRQAAKAARLEREAAEREKLRQEVRAGWAGVLETIATASEAELQEWLDLSIENGRIALDAAQQARRWLRDDRPDPGDGAACLTLTDVWRDFSPTVLAALRTLPGLRRDLLQAIRARPGRRQEARVAGALQEAGLGLMLANTVIEEAHGRGPRAPWNLIKPETIRAALPRVRSIDTQEKAG